MVTIERECASTVVTLAAARVRRLERGARPGPLAVVAGRRGAQVPAPLDAEGPGDRRSDRTDRRAAGAGGRPRA